MRMRKVRANMMERMPIPTWRLSRDNDGGSGNCTSGVRGDGAGDWQRPSWRKQEEVVVTMKMRIRVSIPAVELQQPTSRWDLPGNGRRRGCKVGI